MSKDIYSINLNGKLVSLQRPLVMAIINITPDSFYSGSRFNGEKEILNAAEKAIDEGATILDIGAYSTRPMAEDISLDEEKKRLAFALEVIRSRWGDVFLSVDTFRADVARFVVNNFEVPIINDIGGGTLDGNMFVTIAELNVAYVLMHTRGNPHTMQQLCHYSDTAVEILTFLQKQLHDLRILGVKDVIVDPGFGFAKDLKQNYELLRKQHYFKELDAPILAGLSRKSMIYKLIDQSPDKALNGTTACNMLALMGGANILRVHDTKEAMETIQIFEAYCGQELQ